LLTGVLVVGAVVVSVLLSPPRRAAQAHEELVMLDEAA